MYQSSFGFHSRPFSASPRHDWFFESESAQQVYQSIVRCVERAAGSAMLIGAPGTGKSLMCQLIAHNLRATFSVVVLDSNRLCTRRALLQNILFELGLPFRDMEEGELRLSLMDFLQPSPKCPNGMLLLVDEAHVLPMRLLEELRMITNLIRNGQPRVRLVLAGNRTLEERFAHPKLESFNQRIATRCYMKPLNRTETADYVRYQLEKAGGAQCAAVIAKDAMPTIYETTEGLPRLINQVCDHALLLAAADGKKIVTAETIAEAWADIQQLPTPWHGTGSSVKEGPATIEFGELDAAEPGSTAEVDELLNEAAIEFGGESVTPADSAPTGDLDAESGELESDDPLETLDNITKAIGDASAAVAEASVEAATSKPDPSTLSTPGHSETVPSTEIVAEQDPQFAFDGPSDPFAEEFESEETVADPFPAEQLAAARLAATTAMHSDVHLIEEHDIVDHDEDAVELSLATPLASNSIVTPAADSPREKGEASLAASPVHAPALETDAASQQDSDRDEIRVAHQPEFAHQPEVTVTFDKQTGHSIFTIGGTKQASSATADIVSPVSATDVHEQPTEADKKSATASGDAELQDDRDMIIGIDDLHSPIRVASNTHPDQAKKAKAHRAEYQSLFSRMRNG